MRIMTLSLPGGVYDIYIGNGILNNVASLFKLKRKVFILTDSNVPCEYSQAVSRAAEDSTVYTVKSGEESKSLAVMSDVLEAMLSFGLTRTDCVVAVGGGVVGDLAGFCAASYMRGIDFYNIPTTTLSQLDSSIGGKTAVNLGGIKNVVGAFYQPKGVLIDTAVLKTLSKRHFAAGLAEGVKMALTSDAALFERFESENVNDGNIEEIIYSTLDIKRRVVEKDEKENGIRKILNFGHTLGHGIEAEESLNGLYHGECVALGMIPLCSEEVRVRLIAVLNKLGLPTEYDGRIDNALDYVCHDKKCDGGKVSVITVEKVGECKINKMTLDEFSALIKERL